MNTIFFGLIVLACIAGTVVFIVVMIELKHAIKELKELIRTTERSMKPTLTELQETLKSFRDFTDNLNEVAEDARDFSDSLKGVSEGVRVASNHVKRVSGLVGDISSLARAEVSGIKAGVRTGLQVFLEDLFKRSRNPSNEY